MEGLLDGGGRIAVGVVCGAENCLGALKQRMETRFALRQGLVEKKFPILIKKIKRDKKNGNVRLDEEVEVFTAESFLEFGEGEGA